MEIHSSFTPLGARPSCILTFASCLTCLSSCLLSADCSPASVYPSVSSAWKVSHTLTMLIFYSCIFFFTVFKWICQNLKSTYFKTNAVRYVWRAVPAYSLAHRAIILHNCSCQYGRDSEWFPYFFMRLTCWCHWRAWCGMSDVVHWVFHIKLIGIFLSYFQNDLKLTNICNSWHISDGIHKM